MDDQEKDKTYFGYYGMLVHQQNMLMDNVRTSLYQRAILSNAPDFAGKVVLDVGTGTGILSFFAAQAGARRVYAVEASSMANYAEKLAAANGYGDVVRIIRGKIEDITIDEKIDIIVSEPMGVLLVHERMLESYLTARKRFLPSQGLSSQMYPSGGNILLAPFSDIGLYAETLSKISFWQNRNFHNIDISPLLGAAADMQFAQPVVGPIDPKLLLSSPNAHFLDFCSLEPSELEHFEMRLTLEIGHTGICHGLAGWFDVSFTGSIKSYLLSTGPSDERTHWQHVRFLFPKPSAVNRGQFLKGAMEFKANDQRSYDLFLRLTLHSTSEEATIIKVRQRYSLQDQQYWNIQGPSFSDVPKEHFGIY